MNTTANVFNNVSNSSTIFTTAKTTTYTATAKTTALTENDQITINNVSYILEYTTYNVANYRTDFNDSTTKLAAISNKSSTIFTTTKTTTAKTTALTENGKITIKVLRGWTNYYFNDTFVFDDNKYASFYSNYTIDIPRYSWYDSEKYCKSLFTNHFTRGKFEFEL